MNDIIDFLSQPWPWWVAGPVISLLMFSLIYFGNSFGFSANFRNICSILGAGKSCDYFDFDWKKQVWNLVFAVGAILGGFIASQYLTSDMAIQLSEATVTELQDFGIENPGADIVPMSIFNFESLLTLKGFVFIVLGGFFVGFGTRYAGGCTSGHAISGLSDLQPASLIAVVGFFIGGLSITYFVLPYLLPL
ncbi:MAG: YeeE/YedE family protein [Cytophagales bacterium CG12_big_fil_rev_8_21_14_0_65_40_12]|nr:MAG: YeeE/YedE family protein [Cytophagales bacterium CG12_big_fil_rev_8_21_14_0_65_40_12]PIW03152.1 MAG: YeeE/YedE family protein [Cytophagales bacterium CG17_big_fil_post_rev_8_21_14_2_50_40_13]